jgi:hypothetical protein
MTNDRKPKGKGTQIRRDYEVGKGKPPKDSQFQPGVSGNPSGRPKKPQKLHSAMIEILSRDITLTVNGQKKTMSTKEALLFSMTTKALKASVKDQLGVINLIRDLEKDAPIDLGSLLDFDS